MLRFDFHDHLDIVRIVPCVANDRPRSGLYTVALKRLIEASLRLIRVYHAFYPAMC